jgi:fibronectin type III domain protein
VLAYEVEAIPIDAIFGGGPVGQTGGVFETRKTSLTVHHLADGQHYLVGVAAYNGDGASNAFGKTVTPGSVPSAPRELHAVGQAGSITLIWTGPKSDGGFRVTHYRIQYATCSLASSTCKAHTVRVSGYRHQVELRHLSANTTYRLRVTGQNKRGYGHPSRVISTRTS